jgi:thymidylate synthase (FAD)
MSKIIKASYEIMDNLDREYIDRMMLALGRYAGICYRGSADVNIEDTKDKSAEQIEQEQCERRIINCIKRGHESVIEHEKLTVKFLVDRGVTHELVRHRLASFTQESTRYCNYDSDVQGNNVKFIDVWPAIDAMDIDEGHKNAVYLQWKASCDAAEKKYQTMLLYGATPQVARAVLPTSTAASIVVTANLREWRHLLKLRTDKAAHPQMREVMVPLLEELKNKMPIIFGDITY